MSFASVPAAEAPVKFQIDLQTLIPYLADSGVTRPGDRGLYHLVNRGSGSGNSCGLDRGPPYWWNACRNTGMVGTAGRIYVNEL